MQTLPSTSTNALLLLSDPGVRVSLANLNEYDYVKIGKAVRTVLEEYYKEYRG